MSSMPCNQTKQLSVVKTLVYGNINNKYVSDYKWIYQVIRYKQVKHLDQYMFSTVLKIQWRVCMVGRAMACNVHARYFNINIQNEGQSANELVAAHTVVTHQQKQVNFNLREQLDHRVPVCAKKINK